MAPRQTAREKVLNQSYEYDTFDIVVEYLMNNGHAETIDEAVYLMVNMSEEWRQSIIENRQAARDPDGHGRIERQSETRGQSAERRVRNRLRTMDPEKAEKMKAQMRAVGLDV